MNRIKPLKPSKESKLKRGKIAENRASLVLRKKGYNILARNIRFYGIEIDYLVKKEIEGEYHYFFFEIKRIKNEHYNAGYLPFSFKQYMKYRKAIDNWHAELNKIKNSHIGLILFNENSELLDFNPHYVKNEMFNSQAN
ncbi:MAG: YraN family protein [Spirochaetia bacterium]|nr:YraN family protein [Spirochaetia bacterium]